MGSARLPAARYFALTWGIPDGYGGMTTAIFRRSNAFHEHGAPVTVLTFDGRTDYPQLIQQLRERGSVSAGTTILNLWEWLREHELPSSTVPSRAVFTPLPPESDAPAGEPQLTRTRLADDGRTVLQIDYLRADGSLLATDRRDCYLQGVLGGRSVVLCDRTGHPVSHWSRIIPLYHAWVDALTAGDTSVLMIDSKTVATLFLDYRPRPNVITVHVVHGSHLANPTDPGSGFSTVRRAVFENLDRFDAVVLLSDRQRREVLTLAPGARTLRVIPNAVPVVPPTGADRERGAGVVLASLLARKRISHAIAASIEAGTRLDVFGDGPVRDRLHRQIEDAGASGRIRLRGYDPAAKDRLPTASFLLLTSTTEGFPLVLLESMAAGCIPIAYDIRYGPGELIRDGVNGFLVPDGDQAALAAAITRLQRMPEAQVLRMRRRARRSAARYTPDAIMTRWAAELRRLLRRRRLNSARTRLGRRLRRIIQRR